MSEATPGASAAQPGASSITPGANPGEPIGFVGLGNMGAPMASRLLGAGHTLIVYDVSASARDALIERGAQPAGSVQELASRVSIVFLSLPTPDVVQSVVLGAAGIVHGTRLTHVVDLSTTGPRVVASVAQQLASRAIAFIDSPVSGGVAGARAGTLAVMAACGTQDFDRLRPLLACLGKPFHVGNQPGLGQMMKLVNNLLSGAALAITSEAMLLGAKAGLDPDVMIEVINSSTGRNSASQDKFPKSILPRRFDAGFATRLMYKDLKLCLEEAEALGLSLSVASAVRQLWLQTYNEIGPDRDFTTIMQCVERGTDFEVRGRAAGQRSKPSGPSER